ncbi:MAG: hypothetical protein HPY50_04670 [Firmicutes bacterium]|nr:hypothetical protein [Bacillota bacterium]
MDYSRAFKDALNEITYLKGKYREGQENGDQGLSDWAAKEAEKHYDIIARESPRHADMLRSIGYEAAQLYSRQIPATPDAAQTSASAHSRETFSSEQLNSNPTRAGMGEVKAAERRNPYTLAERRQIDDAVERAARLVAAEPDYGWQRPTWSGEYRAGEPRLGMPEEYLPGRSLPERGNPGSISFGLQKAPKPTVEMPGLYRMYGNIGSRALPAEHKAGEEQPPSWLEKVAKFLEPASQAQEETGGGQGIVIPPGSFNIFNQSESEPRVSFEQLYKDSRSKYGTFSEEWLRNNPPPTVERLDPNSRPKHGTFSEEWLRDNPMPAEESGIEVHQKWDVENNEAHKPLQPKFTSDENLRSPYAYDMIIDQFKVADNPRYKRRNGNTYCNIFAWDVTNAMGAEIPYWVDATTWNLDNFQI